MSISEFPLPDPGEGLTEAEISSWRVQVGDEVKVNDIVVEIETAKSLVELPIPFAGTVSALLVQEGATVEVGTPIIAVDTGGTGAATTDQVVAAPTERIPADGVDPKATPVVPAAPPGQAAPAEASTTAEPTPADTTATNPTPDDQGRTAVLVGYGVKQTEAKRRPRKAAPAASAQPDPVPSPTQANGSANSAVAAAGAKALASPPVRKRAKDLGIDLGAVAGSGPGGIVTRSDLEAHHAPVAAAGSVVPSGPGALGVSGGSGWSGGETRVPVKGVRKMTAQAMVSSAFTAPHVTEWVTLDVTATMDLVARLKRDREFADTKVTPLLVLAKAVCVALRRHPEVNASWDDAAQEIVHKHYVNLGIAAATPRGLVVPNIKDAQALTMPDLGRALGALIDTAREGRTPPADMTGGTITITNVGVFGVDTGTPILNPGEAAIVAFGAIRRMPWVVTGSDGQEAIEPRWVTQLGLSFDHRLIDGELGSRFLADLATLLGDPSRALVWS